MKHLFYSLLCLLVLVSCDPSRAYYRVYDRVSKKIGANGGELLSFNLDDINRAIFFSQDSTFYYQDVKPRSSRPQEIIHMDSEVDVIVPHVVVTDDKSTCVESTIGRMTIRQAMKTYSCEDIMHQNSGYLDIKTLASAVIFTPSAESPNRIVVYEDDYGSHKRQPILIYFINNPGKLFYVWLDENYHISQANTYTSAYIDLLGDIEVEFQDTPDYVSLPEDSHYILHIPSSLNEYGTIEYGDKVIFTSSGAEFPSSVLNGDVVAIDALRDSIWCYYMRLDEAVQHKLLGNYFDSCENFGTIYDLYHHNPVKAREQYPLHKRIRAYAKIDKISQSYGGDYMLIQTHVSFNELDIYTKDDRVLDFETPCYVYFEGDFDYREPGILSWDSTTYFRFHNATIVGYQYAPLFDNHEPIMIVDDSVIHKYRHTDSVD